MAQAGHSGRKVREGTVVSDKMDKTVVVAVGSSMRNRIYKKIVRRIHRFMAHDETNDAKLGDRVLIVESRPYSRRKRWQLAEVLVRADRPEIAAEEIDLELLGEVKTEEEEEAPAPVEAVAEEVAPEAEGEEAPVPDVVSAEEAPLVEEAVGAAVEEAEVKAEVAEVPEAAVEEAEAKAEVAEVSETTTEEPEAKAEVTEVPEAAVEEPKDEAEAEADEVAKEATEEPQSEDVEQSS